MRGRDPISENIINLVMSNLICICTQLNEECFTLRATMVAIEADAKYNAEKDVKKLKSESSFLVSRARAVYTRPGTTCCNSGLLCLPVVLCVEPGTICA